MHGVGKVNIQTDSKINRLINKKEEVIPLFYTLYVLEIKYSQSACVIEKRLERTVYVLLKYQNK